MSHPTVNPLRLHRQLLAAAFPVASVDSAGTICFTRQLSSSEQSQLETILNQHDPAVVPEPAIDERIAALEDAFHALLELYLSS